MFISYKFVAILSNNTICEFKIDGTDAFEHILKDTFVYTFKDALNVFFSKETHLKDIFYDAFEDTFNNMLEDARKYTLMLEDNVDVFDYDFDDIFIDALVELVLCQIPEYVLLSHFPICNTFIVLILETIWCVVS